MKRLVFVFLLSGCSPQGLEFLSHLEARKLKVDALAKREMCDSEFREYEDEKSCYLQEVALLVTDSCVEMRRIEPMLQEDCEDLLYRIVMKPASFFEPADPEDSFPGIRTGECGNDQDCRDICDDVFRSSTDRDHCEDLSIVAVNRIKDVFDVLERPDTNNLESLDLRDLDRLLDISSDPLETAINQMSSTEVSIFLVWLAEDPEAAQLIEDAEDDFNILEELFGTSRTNILSELNKNIDSGDTFVEIALDEGNDVVLEWIHDFFGHKCENENRYERCLFKDYYCGLQLATEAEEEYFDQDFFDDLLNEILEEERKPSGAPSWWTTSTDAGDLDSWKTSPHNVCTSMKP